MVEEKRGFCTLRKSRCSTICTIEDGRLTAVRLDSEDPNGAATCPKGRAAPEVTRSTRRLTTPMRRRRPDARVSPLHVRRRDNANGARAKSRRSRAVPVDELVVLAHDTYSFERDRCRSARDCDFVLVNLFHAPLGAPMRPGRSTSR